MKKETNNNLFRVFSEHSRLLKIIFIAVFFALSLLPTAAYLFGIGNENGENNEPAACPKAISENGLNENFDADFEKYFSENFGFRQQLVTGLTAFDYYVLGTSAVEKVTAGQDGWLFLTETLDDFDGSESYSDRTIYRIAETVRLMDRYAQSKGSRFVFLCAPDKATVYPEYLPEYISACASTNLDRLTRELKNDGSYIDIKDMFLNLRCKNDTQYYYKYDSHWNNTGALEVFRAVQDNIALIYPDVSVSSTDTDLISHSGDLGRMLLPKGHLSESDVGYRRCYKALQPMSNLMAMKLETEKEDAEHSLYMFRDSFGSSLIDLFSNNYARTCYSRTMPYSMREAGKYDIIVLEKVERELRSIVEYAPDAPCVQCGAPLALSETRKSVDVQFTENDTEIKVSGILPSDIPLSENDNIYICVSERLYFEAYPIAEKMPDNDRGFCVLLEKSVLPEGDAAMKICVGNSEQMAAYAVSPM